MFGTPDSYQVVPDGNKWRVIRGTETLSTHRKKSAAKRKARELATEGDKLTIRRSDGTIQEKTTVQ